VVLCGREPSHRGVTTQTDCEIEQFGGRRGARRAVHHRGSLVQRINVA